MAMAFISYNDFNDWHSNTILIIIIIIIIIRHATFHSFIHNCFDRDDPELTSCQYRRASGDGKLSNSSTKSVVESRH